MTFSDNIKIICSRQKRDEVLWNPHQITHRCSHMDLHFHGIQKVYEKCHIGFLIYVSWGWYGPLLWLICYLLCTDRMFHYLQTRWMILPLCDLAAYLLISNTRKQELQHNDVLADLGYYWIICVIAWRGIDSSYPISTNQFPISTN